MLKRRRGRPPPSLFYKNKKSEHAAPLEKFIVLAKKKVDHAFVICNVHDSKPITKNVTAVSWSGYFEWLDFSFFEYKICHSLIALSLKKLL